MPSSPRDIPDFLDQISEGFLVSDRGGQIIEVNQRLEEMFGYPPGQLVGQRVELLVPDRLRGVHEGHRMGFSNEPARRSMGSGLDLLGRRKDGSEFPIEVSLAPASYNGHDGVYALIIDITQRKQAERLLEAERNFTSAILETLGALVVVLDREGRIIRFNRACQETTGYRRGEVEGKPLWDLFPVPEDVDAVRTTLRKTVAGETTKSYESQWLTRDGEKRLIAWSNTAIHDETGEVKHVVATGLDITERKQLEEQYLQAQKMEAIGRLAGGVAHDFNNVLSVLSFDTEVLMDQLDDEGSKELLEEMSRVIDRGASIVRELLNFSRPQVATPVIVDLNETVRDSSRMLQILVGESVGLDVITDPRPATVKIEGGQIEQILMNLAANARDAMPTGGRLRLEVDQLRITEPRAQVLGVESGSFVLLKATDTGSGIDESIRDRIFEPFFTTKKVGKGTGLGLSTTYGIVTGAGGTITCENGSDGGAMFTAYFPLAGERLTKTNEPAPHRNARRGRETILLVEDEEGLEISIRRVLEDTGYQVLHANDGKEAERLSQQHSGKIHVLLTDVVLPGLGGPDLANRVKTQHPNVQTIFMSGHIDDEGMLGLADSDDLLEKPFKRQELLGRVRAVLEGGEPGA